MIISGGPQPPALIKGEPAMTAWTETRPPAEPGPAGDIIPQGPAGAGDAGASAVEELFQCVYPRLAGWVRRMVGDDDIAHEIASEAFTRLLARWARVESPRSYLYMIAANLVRDQWRQADREQRAVRSLAAGTAGHPVTWPMQDVYVRSLIASLPPRLHDPFLLYYYGGLKVREVAGLLGKPEGTVKADLFAARAQLRSALGERGR
jgi:RNA polymerase sigma-70 factor (ECF subfamily)